MAKHDSYCEVCANTGILRATLVQSESGEREVEVAVCENQTHSSGALAEKSVEGMQKMGLPIRVLEV